MKLIERIKNLFRSEDNISDGYHTFNQLYDYRMIYNAMAINALKNTYLCYKSHKHSDGKLCFGGGWFIVTIELPTGQVSNHYPNKYWDLFDCNVLDKAKEWDGHTPDDAFDRMVEFTENHIDDLNINDISTADIVNTFLHDYDGYHSDSGPDYSWRDCTGMVHNFIDWFRSKLPEEFMDAYNEMKYGRSED